MYIGLHVKCPLFLSDFNETSIFLTDFRKNAQISNIMKILSVGSEFIPERRTDGQSDRHDEAHSGFSRFSKRF